MHNQHYIQMIDSIDPVAILQQEGQEILPGARRTGLGDLGYKRSDHYNKEQREILAAIQQRKQQSRRQQQIPDNSSSM